MMLKFNPTYAVFAIWMLFSVSAKAESPVFSQSKSIQKAYKVSNRASIDITNKYGKIVFINWDKDSVKIEVNILSEGSKLDRVMQQLNSVEIRFMGNIQYVEASTTWSSGTGILKKSLQEIRQGLNATQKLEITYTVYLPKTCDINVDNQFGDVYISDLEGSLQADIAHGSFRANKIKKIRRLKVKYGDIRIDNVQEANIDAHFGDVELNSCGELNLDCSTTDIILGDIESLSLMSKNDEIQIDRIKNINGTSTLSDIKIKKLLGKADLNSKFGDIKVYYLDKNLGRLNLSGSFTNYIIMTSSGINCSFKVVMEDPKDFSYDTGVSVTKESKEAKTKTYVGTIGNGGEENIRIYAKSGHVKFQL